MDIVNGNLKLILGLIWSLIVRYQIGRSKFPPRKLMLAWLQAVLPECKVGNFTTDWNSGVLLSALIDYCRPGLFPHWRKLGQYYILHIGKIKDSLNNTFVTYSPAIRKGKWATVSGANFLGENNTYSIFNINYTLF